MENARLKDLERLSMALAVSTHRTTKTGQFWTLVASELMRKNRYEEIRQFPRSFISLVAYSVMANHYCDELINLALKKTTIQSASSNVIIIFRLFLFLQNCEFDLHLQMDHPMIALRGNCC